MRPIITATPWRDSVKLELAAEVLQRFSQLRFVAYGTSMLPSIYPGDCLTVTSFGSTPPRCGDIVLCRHGGEFRVHRVARIWNEGPSELYVLRGDALGEDDPPVPGCELLGRVTSVLRRGRSWNLEKVTRLPDRLLRSMVRSSSLTAALLLTWHAVLTPEASRASLLPRSTSKPRTECA
jgi:Peptidase S24-like